MKINVHLLATHMAASRLTAYLLQNRRGSEIMAAFNGRMNEDQEKLYDSFYADAVKTIESCRQDDEDE
jgi:hypothetical protein